MPKVTAKRSIRILFDLQATQTFESGSRGVGRYSRDLFDAINKLAHPREIFGLFNSYDKIENFESLQESRKIFFPHLPKWHTSRDYNGGDADTLDSLALSAFIGPVKADIIHISHIFEGFESRIALPNCYRKPKGQIFSATLYDLIPLRFQEHYFQDSNFKKWYISRLNYLRHLDILFAISESSRQDAINLLNIDPARVITLPGGVSPVFKPNDNLELRHNLKRKYCIKNRFIMYTGGYDYRKNLRGAIEAFANLPFEIRRGCQFLIIGLIDPNRKNEYLNQANKLGLFENDIIFTGFIPEEDLVGLYSICDLFIFPSLYEGLGLPVLEAMSCGAPVIGSDNSSIKDTINLPEALFNASSTESITEKMCNVLTNDNFATHLRQHGRIRVQRLSWEASAQIAIDAFDEALRVNQQNGIKAAIHGWLPKKRMALFTPLPPSRSGVADYNANFLPYLAKYFEIDIYVDNYLVTDETITSLFRIYNVSDFEAVAHAYDVILYEMGNSEFHTHMIRLCQKYPGIIGLHDAYLSGLMGYIEFNQRTQNFFSNEMLYSHSTTARNYLAPSKKTEQSNHEAIVNLPCTKRILDSALGVISHSPFNLETSRFFYPEGHAAPYRIINQMVKLMEPICAADKNKIRSGLNFTSDDFIICTFGHVTWNKYGDILIEAIATSFLRNQKCYLFFVGELPQDNFGSKILNLIEEHNLKDKIIITGFLEEDKYHNYLQIADLAIQLRKDSRGGTPKGVLDCLNYSVPVIINDDASYKDYPENVAFKLTAFPSVEDVREAFELLYQDRKQLKLLTVAGQEYINNLHNPEESAAQYAIAIHEFCDREQYTKNETYYTFMGPHFAHSKKIKSDIKKAVNFLNSSIPPLFKRRRLLIDVSHITKFDHETGIQRVVKEIIKAAYCFESPGIEVIAFELKNDKLVPAFDWLEKLGLLLPRELSRTNKANNLIEFCAGDILFMLDSSWQNYRNYLPTFEKASCLRIPVYTVVYDILPITLPPDNFVAGGKEWFTNWLECATKSSDALICISKATADELINWLATRVNFSETPKVGFWHLGCDFVNHGEALDLVPKINNIIEQPYLLMVGTIEPRKNHHLAIAAMEKLWQEGSELCLCIAGKEGWLSEQTLDKIRTHPLHNKKLFFIEKTIR